ncbi:hypothetical protein METBIDRAFT_31224 [Metschnikowia bicuspidata var. bicuspidata NRRL YB-4993]|uniref:Damage-regulated import facilitator 1 n=1 Tax=Metschnikowia bicuspidata var. bicuspidata NRRL YB-4993 TaxID=869754 RepID=A0A1A0HE89_9ASCO|nr:hypothetical protein METBIDRAFT_31224 [Metschnikowia bicuspidata var. bicuspidata NRRL YB-4993]OBA22305.1 hypothetical protein METBIDRAFT_31224 [Metschnikowia bicuspidata var. bicuspidata NRRL YB-4993]
MENPHTKRQMHQAPTPENADPYAASLMTLGMRIRKAVADGHPGNRQYSYKPQFGGESVESQPRNQPERTPLPAHLSQPPALTSDGSTFQSGLNVCEWGAPSVNVQTLPLMGTKRKHDEEPDETECSHFEQHGGHHGYHAGSARVSSFGSWEEFSQKNGALHFDEDF